MRFMVSPTTLRLGNGVKEQTRAVGTCYIGAWRILGRFPRESIPVVGSIGIDTSAPTSSHALKIA